MVNMACAIGMLLASSAVVTAALVVQSAEPAYAASLGTITLTPSAGSVTDDPFVTGLTTTQACPTGYGDVVTVRVRASGSTASGNALGRSQSAGGYDTAVLSLVGTADSAATSAVSISLLQALGGSSIAEGNYEIYISCTEMQVAGEEYADHFSTTITVTGTTWQVASDGGTTSSSSSASARASASASTSASASASTTVSTSGSVTGSASVSTSGSASATASESGSASDAAAASTTTTTTTSTGGSLPTTGTPIMMIAGSGLVLAATGGGIVYLSRRRHRRAWPLAVDGLGEETGE